MQSTVVLLGIMASIDQLHSYTHSRGRNTDGRTLLAESECIILSFDKYGL